MKWALLLLFGSPLFGQSRRAADGAALCYEVQRTISSIMGSGAAECIPSAGARPSAISPIVVFSRACFSVPSRQRACLLMAVGAIGKAMRDLPRSQIDDAVVLDINSAREGWGYKFPASIAKSLQIRMSSDQIGADTAYSELTRSMSRYSVKR